MIMPGQGRMLIFQFLFNMLPSMDGSRTKIPLGTPRALSISMRHASVEILSAVRDLRISHGPQLPRGQHGM